MFTRFRILATLGIISLAGCGGLNQVSPTPSDNKPEGYLVTLKVSDGSNQATLEKRYSGKALIFDAKSGFAILQTNTAPPSNDPAIKTVSKNAEALAPDTKPTSEVGLDGNTSSSDGSNAWSGGAGAWSGGWQTWGSGTTAWSGGAGAWSGGAGAWSSGTVVPALPSDNQTAWNQIKLYEAHRLSRNFGGGIKVAVIDTGIDLNHPMFAGKLSNSSEWWDYVGNDATPQDEAGGNGYGHGTAVAGIILQVAPRAKILPIRVLRPDGNGDTAKIVSAIARAVNMGAQVINLSLGTDGWDNSLYDVCYWANNYYGVRIVASAGNNGQLNGLESPAVFSWNSGTYQKTIGIGSVNNSDILSSFSAYGDGLYAAAPGEQIYSAFPSNQSAKFTGTSFAAPIFSGAIALAYSEMPANTPRDTIEDSLWSSFDWTVKRSGSSTIQTGRLNLENLIRKLYGWSAPTNIQAGVYQIANVNSGKCLDVRNAATSNGTQVDQYACHTGDHQKWQIESLGSGLYKLKAMHSGRLLSIGGGTPANQTEGAKTTQWDDGTYNDQKWYIQASGSAYQLKNYNSGKCLDVYNWSTADGQQLQQWTCSGNTAQQFKLKALF
jgi:thermitase